MRWRSTVGVVELDQGRDGRINREILPDVQHAFLNHTFKDGYGTLLSCPGRSSYTPFQFLILTSISTKIANEMVFLSNSDFFRFSCIQLFERYLV